jgi:2-polyprenyl-3-methyl-5-hydroxy-6-metoxy-1,4-benzoquinol methylase
VLHERTNSLDILKSETLTKVDNCPVCDCPTASVVNRHGALYNEKTASTSVISVLCHGCELVYNNPRVHDVILEEFYNTEQSNLHGMTKTHIASQANNPMTAIRLGSIESLLFPGSVVLEVGGGISNLACALTRDNKTIKLFGIDPSIPESAQIYDNLYITKGLFDIHGITSLGIDTFDMVIANHVLEHMQSPRDFLALVKHVLSPNGNLVLEVPNTFAPFWALPSLEKYFRTVHLSNYSRRPLERLLNNAGFQCKSWNTAAVHSISVVAISVQKPVENQEYRPRTTKIRVYFFLWKVYGFLLKTAGLHMFAHAFSRIIARLFRLN